MRRGLRTPLWLAAGAYALTLALVSLLPSGDSAPAQWDKAISPTTQNVMHVPAYAVLAILMCGLVGRGIITRVLPAFLACGAYGGILECAQAAIPGRMGSFSDALLNVVGAAAGCLAMLVWRRLRPGPAPRPAEVT